MTVGVYVWYSGQKISINFLPLFVFLYITQVFPIIFPLKYVYLITFYTKYFVLSYFIDVFSTLFNMVWTNNVKNNSTLDDFMRLSCKYVAEKSMLSNLNLLQEMGNTPDVALVFCIYLKAWLIWWYHMRVMGSLVIGTWTIFLKTLIEANHKKPRSPMGSLQKG